MIISPLERKTLKGRLALGVIYLALFLGSSTMLYPFLLMVRLSTADATDKDTLSPVPEFWWDINKLALKYVDYEYFVTDSSLAQAYGSEGWTNLAQSPNIYKEKLAPLMGLPPAALQCRYDDFTEYRKSVDPRFLYMQCTYVPGSSWEDFWIQYYLARRDKVSPRNFLYIEPQKPDWRRRDWTPTYDQAWRDWEEWLGQLRPDQRYVFSVEATWQQFLKRRYENDLARLNKAHGAAHQSFFGDLVLPLSPPAPGTRLREDWDIYVVEFMPLYWQRLTPEAIVRLTPQWRTFVVESKQVKSAEDWTLYTGLPAQEIGSINLTEAMPLSEVGARWWCEFVALHAKPEDRILASSEQDFRDFVRRRYSDLVAFNKAWDGKFASWDAVRLPVADADAHVLSTNRFGISCDRTLNNYRRAGDILIGSGLGPFANTAIIIALSIITSLTVNPVAAYALSRFKLQRTQKALVFLLGTMALPGEVALVPGFLLVRDLGLTDNFLALVLPGAANAFSIFLLKGFFDSLPPELYEAASIDGASEIRMFFQITLPLSMPIIAVTMLGTITASYNLFMPAVMYLGDTSMWPVATKIYEINQTQPLGIGMAALVIASIFPLALFIFCQRIIMRGIILPSMK